MKNIKPPLRFYLEKCSLVVPALCFQIKCNTRPWRICSQPLSGSLKQWTGLNLRYATFFSCIYIHFTASLWNIQVASIPIFALGPLLSKITIT